MLQQGQTRETGTSPMAQHASWVLIAILGALGALNPLSIDASLPALPAIGHELHAADAALQLTLGGFMLAFGLGQLFHGPLSDRWGRRPVALLGLVLYALAGLACTLAPTITILVVARIIQGFGAAAGMVVSRSVVRDVASDNKRAAALQAYVSAVFAIAPVIAPLFGATLLSLGWRAIYGVLTGAGALLLLIAWFGLPETRSRETLEARMPVVTAYLSFLRLPRSLSLSLLIGVAFAGYFGFISGSPFVLQGQLGVSSTVYAVAFTAAAVLLLAGSLLAGRLASALGAERLLLLGCMGLALSGVLAFGLNTLAGPPSVPGFILAMGCFAFCFGIAIPNAFAIGLQNAGVVAGTGTAILGSAQMLGGSIGSTGIGLLPTSAAAAVGLFAIVTGLITAILYVVSRR